MINMAARHRANKSAPALNKSNFGFDMPANSPVISVAQGDGIEQLEPVTN